MQYKLSQSHIDHFATSGISQEVAEAAGIYTETDQPAIYRTIKRKHGPDSHDFGPAIVIPYEERPAGLPSIGYARIRPDRPRVHDSGAVAKYDAPARTPTRVYAPTWVRAEIWDESRPLWITEGEKKALSLIENHIACIALPGIFNGTTTSKDANEETEHVLRGDLAKLVAGRKVTVCFDADSDVNPNLPIATARLLRALEAAGCETWCSLPPGPEKGIDDLIASRGFGHAWQLLAGSKWQPRKPWLRLGVADAADRPLIAWRAWRLLNQLVDDSDEIAEIRKNTIDHLAIDAATLDAWLDHGDRPDGEERPEGAPWTIETRKGERTYVLSNGLRIAAGTDRLRRRSGVALAKLLLADLGAPLVHHEGSYWLYERGAWRPTPQKPLRRWVTAQDGRSTVDGGKLAVHDSTISNTIKCLEALIGDAAVFGHPRAGLAYRDRTVLLREDLSGLEVVDHDPAHGLRIWIDSDCPDLTATSATWSSCLDRLLTGPDESRVFREWVGIATLGLTTRYSKALWLYGAEGSGKSTVAKALASLWPDAVRTAIKPDRCEGEYEAAKLATSAFNLVTEIDEKRESLSVESLKALISGDQLSGRHPYGQIFDFAPRAAWMIASNHVPQVNDSSAAFQSRIIALNCPTTIRDTDDDDKSFGGRLRADLPSFAIECLQAAVRVVAAGGAWEMPASVITKRDEWLIESDPVRAWIDDVGVIADDTAATAPHDVYLNYRTWCEENGHRAASATSFGRRLRSLGIDRVKSNGRRVYRCRLPVPPDIEIALAS